MYQLRKIGTIKAEQESILITVDPAYHKALKYVDQFSHIHVFYTQSENDKSYLKQNIAAVKTIDVKKGIVNATGKWGESGSYQLLDIKPYFPCEDSIKPGSEYRFDSDTDPSESEPSNRILLTNEEKEAAWSVHPIGQIRTNGRNQYIQFDQEIDVDLGYLIVYWWFDKFDDNRYRRITECNPPYENAPRSGILATRSPVRPNPIAMTIVKAECVDPALKRVYIREIECFDKTPCIGVCAYSMRKDCRYDTVVPEWLSHWPKYLDLDQDKEHAIEEIKMKDSSLSRILFETETAEDNFAQANHSEGNHTQANHSQSNHQETDLTYDNSNEANSIPGIHVYGAREHNLKGIDVTIPYGKITAVVGVSGSGKSSLVNDTIYAECRRRMEFLSNSHNSYHKPDCDTISGCIPAVLISQDMIRGTSLSTVGTYSNAYDELRKMYALVSIRHCPDCGNEIIPLTKEHILRILKAQKHVDIYDLNQKLVNSDSLDKGVDLAIELGQGAFYAELDQRNRVLLQTKQKCYHCDKLMFSLTPQTFSYMDADSRCPICHGTGQAVKIDEEKIITHPELSLLDGACAFYGKLRTFLENPNANWMKGQVFGLAKEFGEDLERPWSKLSKEFRDAVLHGCNEKSVSFTYDNKKNGRNGQITRQAEGICSIIQRAFEEHPDSPSVLKYMTMAPCDSCKGERLRGEGRTATLQSHRYPQAATMTFEEIYSFCNHLAYQLPGSQLRRVETALRSLKEIAQAAISLGIGYLPLNRPTASLSGGERQRLKLLSAAMNHMTGILYVMDEPSKGLHPDDYQRVIVMFQKLIHEGNTILIVEHNEDMIQCADYVIEIGPGAGEFGGMVTGEGPLDEVLQDSRTQLSHYMKLGGNQDQGYYMNQGENLNQSHSVTKTDSFLTLTELHYNNLKHITVTFPKYAMTGICGVSGSGKSSLMKGELYEYYQKSKEFSKVVLVDQLPIGKNSKSIVATYMDLMDIIRMEFAITTAAKDKGMTEQHFSFNTSAGQCSTCKGDGRIKLSFMEDCYEPCPDCNGKRYKEEVLDVRLRHKDINEILNMSVIESMEFWKESSELSEKLSVLSRVGLGYLKLGQCTSTLSGGEASRLKLAKQLMEKQKKNVLYLLDEPTTGLHFTDIDHLLDLLKELVDNDNTVIAIEHNRQFLRECRWKIELGPGAGDAGGEVVRQGYGTEDH